MAGPLTWRNVDSPDFRPALQGMAQFSQLLNQGLAQAREGITRFDDVATDKVNKAFALELAGIQGSPEEYAAGLQTLLSRYDPNRLSYENITAANNKRGQLMDLTLKGLNIEDNRGDLEHEQYVRGRSRGEDAAMDAAAPLFSQIFAARQRDDQATVDQIMGSDEFKTVASALKPEQYAALISRGQGLAQSELGLDSTRFGQTVSQTNFNNSQSDRNDQRVARAAAFALIDSSLGAEEFRDNIMNNPNLSDNQKALAFEIGMNNYGETLQGIPGVSGGGSGVTFGNGVDPTRVMNYEAAGAGFSAVPDTVRTLGQASEFARQVNRAGVPSSAMGVYQIVGQTLRNYAPRALGEDWQNAEFNFENQDKVAEAIFNDNKGSAEALRRQWVSLSPAEAERARKLPWAQAREIIANGESSSSPAQISAGQLRQQTAGANTAIANNINGNRILEVQQTLMEGWTDNTPAISIANTLTGEEGPLSGMDKENLLRQINRVSRDYAVSPAIAGSIILRSVDQQDRINWNGLNSSIRLGDLGLEIDEKLIKEYGRAFQDTDALSVAAGVRQRASDASAAMAAADARVVALEQRILALRQASQTRNVGRQLAQAEAELAAAKLASSASKIEGYEASGAPNRANQILSEVTGASTGGPISEQDLYRQFGFRR